MRHYIAMSGSHGCLPDHCQSFGCKRDAVNDLVELFGLGQWATRRLRQDGYVALSPGAGAEYCEIQECDCHSPETHNDD
jgi:hypothetical protein